ncbi:hypothetical protein CVU76_01680 [Candidatus Dojkabacteria bacterium HGW-Dojkabacteria-1]|uniref:LiaF transmembrane domain-containing protein n=1 Tax=Candidatus Dojkabacteria bacterium HGW-Dojkabacteria-1 TaxID=2013761 RepID=A0A2N2F3J3_9BACT|nr:MAG: hypothetical protein CVU76_01680 [Candidatus Dojkabacteria bacterium HGW-Dojkabacteria-1]
MRNSSRFILGVILITLGILFLIEQTGFFGRFSISIWNLVWTFWPLILIFLGTRLLIERNTNGGLILLVLGVVFLSTNLFQWNFFAVLWPVVIITIGLSILLRREGGSFNTSTTTTSAGKMNESVVFWGVDKIVNSKEFKGGELNVAFGGIKVDLRDAKISKDGAKLHVNCAFGGVEILVPKDCRVITNGTGILGGWESKVEERKIDEPVLEITGGVAFGGVEIK